jgi:hypothetical protein
VRLSDALPSTFPKRGVLLLPIPGVLLHASSTGRIRVARMAHRGGRRDDTAGGDDGHGSSLFVDRPSALRDAP